MYPCNCCKSAHHDISLLSPWSPSESDEEIVNEAILSELGETSLHWFNKLTESYLTEHFRDGNAGSLAASPNVSEGWSPFPKGGIHYIPDSTGKQVTTGDVTPLTALLSSPRQSQNDSNLRASIQAIPDTSGARDFPSSQGELNWTIGMATPHETRPEDNALSTENKENFPEFGQLRERKVSHRQLFSPASSSACDDSFSLVEDDWVEGNLTVETEKTITSEPDLSCGDEVTLCEQGLDISWASAKAGDINCEKLVSPSHSVGDVSCLDRDLGDKTHKSPMSTDACDLNFSNATRNRCSAFEDYSLGSTWERMSDLDLSVVSFKSDEKSGRAKTATERPARVLEKARNSGSSHIKKALSKVFDCAGDDQSDSSGDAVKEDACIQETLPANHDTSIEPDCASNVCRKRQSVETTPQAKRQKLELASKNRAEIHSSNLCKMETSDQVINLDCCSNLSGGLNHQTPGPVKNKGGMISILKNPLTPKSTCKKRVQFSLDFHHGVNTPTVKGCKADAKLMASMDTAGFQLTSAVTLCHLVTAPESGRDAVGSTDLSEYFFKNAGSCRSAEIACQDSESQSKSQDAGHPNNNVDIDLTDYNFDCSFDASPIFSSQVCPSKITEQVDGHQNQISSGITVPNQVTAAALGVKSDTDLNNELGLRPSFVSPGDGSLKIGLKCAISDRAVCDDLCTTAAKVEKQPELGVTMVSEVSKTSCSHSESCDIKMEYDNSNMPAALGCTDASIGQESKLSLVTLVDSPDKLDVCFTSSGNPSLSEATPAVQTQERVAAGVLLPAPKPLTACDSPKVKVKLSLSSGSTRPRKFRYPTADQIARSNPDRPVPEECTSRPTLDNAGQVLAATVITQLSTTGLHQTAIQGDSKKSQFNSSEALKEDEPLGFVTFSEVCNKDITHSNPPVKSSFPLSVCNDFLSTKLSGACPVSRPFNSVIPATTLPPSPSTCWDHCPANLGSSSNACDTGDSCSPAVNGDDTLTSQVWAATEFSQIEEGFDLGVSTCTEGSAPAGSALKKVSEKSADLSVTFSGDDKLLQKNVSNNEMALASLDNSLSKRLCSPNVKHIEAVVNVDSGKCSSDVNPVVSMSDIDSGKCFSDVNPVVSMSDIDSGKCSSDIKHVEAISNIDSEKTDNGVLEAKDFTLCYAGQPNPRKLNSACPKGFATPSGHWLSHCMEAQVNKCLNNLEDQLEFLLSSRKEKADIKEEVRCNSVNTKQHRKQNDKKCLAATFPGRDTIRSTPAMDIDTKPFTCVKLNSNFKRISPGDTGSDSLESANTNQDSEGCTVSSLIGRSSTPARECDDCSPLNSTAMSHSDINNLPADAELRLGSIKIATIDVPQGGFSTAGGRQISLSESARTKAKKIWDSVNEESDFIHPLITEESIPGDPINISTDVEAAGFSFKDAFEGIAVDERPKGFRPFKPPNMKRKNDSKPNGPGPKPGKYPDQKKQLSLELDEWGDDSALRDIIKDEEHLSLVQKTEDNRVMPRQISGLQSSETSLVPKAQPLQMYGFTTGSGKNVPLSKKALLTAEKFWKEFDAGGPASIELETFSAADLLTRDTEHANTTQRSTFDPNFKQPLASGAKLTKRRCGQLSSEILREPNFSSVSISQKHEPLIKDNSGNVFDRNQLSTGKRHWSPNEELSLNSEFSFENVSTFSDCAGCAPHSSDLVNAQSAWVLESHEAGSRAVKATNDLDLLGHRDLTEYPMTTATSGISVPVSERLVKHDGFTTSGSGQMNRQSDDCVRASSEAFSVPTRGVSHGPLPFSATFHPMVKSHVNQMDKHRQTLSEADPSDKCLPKALGFSTASGSKVTVSEIALRQAKILFDECSDTITMTPSSPNTVEQTSVNKAQHQSQGRLPGNLNGGSNKTSSFSGFTTASGGSVSVSEKAWLHARSFLEDSSNLVYASTEAPMVNPCIASSSVDEKLSSEITLKYLSNNCSTYTDPQVAIETSFHQIGIVNAPAGDSLSCCFSTTSGHVSKVTLDHAKGVLMGTPSLERVTESVNAKAYSGGFSTASGHKVNVSKVALDHVKDVLKNTPSNSNTDTPPRDTEFGNAKTYSGGFSTASGHKVNVSRVALDHVKGVLMDTPSNSNSETPTRDTEFGNAKTFSGGFSTASGHKVNVSKVALDHAKGVLMDNPSNSNTDTPARDTEFGNAKTYSGGFSTVSGHKVNVSKVALDHALAVLKNTSLEIESSAIAIQSNPPSPAWHINDHDTVPKTESAKYASTPMNDRRSKSTTFVEGGQTDPLKRSFTPVSSRCEELLYDRPVSRSGKRLYPVRTRSLTNELCSAAPLTNNLDSKSSFKPPYKKVKLSSSKDQEVPATTASGNKKNETPKSSFIPPTFKPPSAVLGTRTSAAAQKVTRGEMPGEGGSKESKISVTGKNDSDTLKAVPRESVDLEDDAENLLLCQDFEARPPASTATSKGHKGEIHSNEQSASSLTGTRVAQNGRGIPEMRTSKDSQETISELVLEEEKMKQEKIIRAKKRTRVRPLCGRWMEARKQRGSLQKLNDFEPTTGLTREELISLGVSASTLEVTGLNAREFRFDLRRFYPALDASVLVGDGALLVPDRCGFAGVDEFYRAFQTLDSVDPGLVDELWLGNHYRWIVWKLAAYEVSLLHCFAGRSLTPDTVMLQLKYRYDREIDACHRSALKKIIERDETPGKRMVLCVASVVHTCDGQCCVEVTDGWYCIRAQLDHRLADLVSRKKIGPGDKIVTSGAELVGAQEACSPLEIKEGMALKLHGNSTRPAPWHSRLGFCLPPSPLCVPIKSLCSDGGLLGCVDVVILRIYPVMYMEKLPDGSCVFCTAEEEDKARQKHEGKREAELEKIYSGLQNESKESFKGSRRNLKKFSKKDVEKLWDGHEISEALDNALNPDEIQLLLSESQMNRLMEHRQRETDRHQEEMKKRLAEAMAETEVRNVTPVLKVKVSGLSAVDVDDSVKTREHCFTGPINHTSLTELGGYFTFYFNIQTPPSKPPGQHFQEITTTKGCLVTVWRPGPEWTSMEEGQRYKLYNLPVSKIRGRSGLGKVSLTATRQTRLKPFSVSDNLLDMVFEPREAWTVSDLTCRIPMGNEFDFLGVVIQKNPPTSLSHPVLLYASDKNGEFLCIKIWSGSQMNSLKCGQIFVAYNLSLSTVSSERLSSVVTAEVRSDLTTVTTNGHSSRYAEAFSEMQILCKHPGFVNGLKSELEICLASHGHRRATKAAPSLSTYDEAEDFPVEIVEKIFSPMSQSPGTSLKSNPISMTGSEANRRQSDKPQNTLQGCGEKGSKSPVSSETTWVKGCPKPGVETADWEREDKAHCSISEKRKQALRDKMAKLLAYDQPAPLHLLPVAGSPACVKEFKSPVNKKT